MTTDSLSGMIGLVTSSLDADYTRRLVAGAAEVLTGVGLSPLCFSPGASKSVEYEIPSDFLGLVGPQYLSGLIFSPTAIERVQVEGSHAEPREEPATASIGEDAVNFLKRMDQLPTVCVGAGIAGTASLWIQNGAGVRLLMKHLTQVCGRRRVAFIRGRERNLEAMSRFRAWEDYCVEHSMPRGDELVELGDFTTPSGEAAALKILEKCAGEPPDAFVAANDRMALGALRALRAKGFAVPTDVSVVGFDDLEAVNADPPLTTIRQPIFEMGHRAAEIVVAKLRMQSIAEEHMFMPQLIVRASCQPNSRTIPPSQPSTDKGRTFFLESSSVEQDTITGVRATRALAIEQLERALSGVASLEKMRNFVRPCLQRIGLQRLTVALLHGPAESQNEPRLVVDCSVSEAAPVGLLGASLLAAEIIAAHCQASPALLSVAEPLYNNGKYCGFLLASGTLLDNPSLHQLGAVLTRTALSSDN